MNYNDLITNGLSFKETLSETSKDTTNNESMTDSQLNVINFDKYKDFHIDNLNLPNIYDFNNNIQIRGIKSNDVLFINKDEIYFIEFKNGAIDNKANNNIHTKLYDSLLIILDALEQSVSFARNNIKYILVYNEDKKHRSSSFNSAALNAISSRLAELSKKEVIHFNLHKFKDVYLKEVHTYTKSEFERKFVDKYKNIDMFVNECSGA